MVHLTLDNVLDGLWVVLIILGTASSAIAYLSEHGITLFRPARFVSRFISIGYPAIGVLYSLLWILREYSVLVAYLAGLTLALLAIILLVGKISSAQPPAKVVRKQPEYATFGKGI